MVSLPPQSNGAESLPTLHSQLCNQLPLTRALRNANCLGKERRLLMVSCRTICTLCSACEVLNRTLRLISPNCMVREQIKILLYPLATDRLKPGSNVTVKQASVSPRERLIRHIPDEV